MTKNNEIKHISKTSKEFKKSKKKTKYEIDIENHMTNYEKGLKLIPFKVQNSTFLKKHHSEFNKFLQTGVIGEKIFEEYCKKNNYNFIRPLYLMWSIYGYYTEKKYKMIPHHTKTAVKKYGCSEAYNLLSLKQKRILIREFIENQESNFSITGFPDYIIWKDNKLSLVEIKTGTGFLSKIQEEKIKKLKECFEVKLYIIRFEAEIKNIELKNIIFEDYFENEFS